MKLEKQLHLLFCTLTAAAFFVMPGTWSAWAEDNTATKNEASETPYKPKTERELRRQLTPMQFEVTQNEGTEPAFKNRTGTTLQIGDRQLFCNTKYKSGTGWSFTTSQPVAYREDKFTHESGDGPTFSTMAPSQPASDTA